MTARDALAELIRSDLLARSHEDDWGVPCVYPEVVSDELADAILAAGWRAPEPEHEWNEDSCIRCGMRYDQSAGTFCPQAVAVTRHADDDDGEFDEYGEWEKIHPDDGLDG